MNKKYLKFLFFNIFLIVLIIQVFQYSSISVIAQDSKNNTPLTSNITVQPMPVKRIFYTVYLNSEKNTSITSFIDTYGIKTFEHQQVYKNDFSYEYVYVIPEKNYSNKLAFLIYRPDGLNNLNNSILWVKEVDQNEHFPQVTDMPAQVDNTGGQLISTPGFTWDTVFVTILISLLVVNIKRKRWSCM